MVTVTTILCVCTVLNSPFVIMSQLFSRHFLFFVNFFFVVVAPKHIYIYFDIDADVPQMLVDVAYIFHVLLLMVVIDGTDRPGRIRIKLATATCHQFYLHHNMIHSFIRRRPTNINEIIAGARTFISMYYCPVLPRI